MKLRAQGRVSRILLLAVSYSLIVTLIGCDAFVRKFTRKSKKDEKEKQELVLAPEEYKGPRMSKEEVYRQYFLYWKSWHDELINSLSTISLSNKKRIDCVNETIKNLQDMRKILQEAKKKDLDVYIKQLNDLKDAISSDSYGNNLTLNRLAAERIKRGILRDFSYDKIKDNLA